MSAAPCAVELETARHFAQLDAEEVAQERKDEAARQTLASIRAALLAALGKGDATTLVPCINWSTGDLDTQKLEVAVADVIDDDPTFALIVKALATDTPEAKAAREAITAKYVFRIEGLV
jgi:hypothetical protein